MIYIKKENRLFNETTGKFLGRVKRIEAQTRVFKTIPQTSTNPNKRRWLENGSTIRGSARALEGYLEFPILTIKENHKMVLQGYLQAGQKLIPVGYAHRQY